MHCVTPKGACTQCAHTLAAMLAAARANRRLAWARARRTLVERPHLLDWAAAGCGARLAAGQPLHPGQQARRRRGVCVSALSVHVCVQGGGGGGGGGVVTSAPPLLNAATHCARGVRCCARGRLGECVGCCAVGRRRPRPQLSTGRCRPQGGEAGWRAQLCAARARACACGCHQACRTLHTCNAAARHRCGVRRAAACQPVPAWWCARACIRPRSCKQAPIVC
jgi:hypothetical protein